MTKPAKEDVYRQVLAAQGRGVHESKKRLSSLGTSVQIMTNQLQEKRLQTHHNRSRGFHTSSAGALWNSSSSSNDLAAHYQEPQTLATEKWHSRHLPIHLNTVLVQVCYELSKIVYGHTHYRVSAWIRYWAEGERCSLIWLHFLRLWFGFWSTSIWMGSSPHPWSAPAVEQSCIWSCYHILQVTHNSGKTDPTVNRPTCFEG